jgi:hypothetical protein
LLYSKRKKGFFGKSGRPVIGDRIEDIGDRFRIECGMTD